MTIIIANIQFLMDVDIFITLFYYLYDFITKLNFVF